MKLGITRIDGILVVCDNCDEEKMYWENAEFYDAIDIDQSLDDQLKDEWVYNQEEDTVYCLECAKKIDEEENES